MLKLERPIKSGKHKGSKCGPAFNGLSGLEGKSDAFKCIINQPDFYLNLCIRPFSYGIPIFDLSSLHPLQGRISKIKPYLERSES
jgi:hypothetical protein